MVKVLLAKAGVVVDIVNVFPEPPGCNTSWLFVDVNVIGDENVFAPEKVWVPDDINHWQSWLCLLKSV